MPLRLLGLFRAHCPLCGGPLGRYWKLVSSVKPKEIGFLSPGSPTALLPSGGTGMPGPVLLRFRCLIGRAPHRTIVAMIYTESKYKHNSSPPPHDLRLPPLSPMSCTSLPRRAPPPSLMLHGRSRQSCARERRASHRFTAARKSGVRRARPNAQIRNQAKWRQALPPTLVL